MLLTIADMHVACARCPRKQLKPAPAICLEDGETLDAHYTSGTCKLGRYVPLAVAGAEVGTAGGVGTELTKIIAQLTAELGLKVEGCQSCFAHAAEMDVWGPDKCEAEMWTIVGWLKVEAERRQLPFDDQAGEWLVRMAIDAERGRLAAVQTVADDNSKGV